MALKTQITSLDEVDEALRPLYTKSGDGFVLDLDDGAYKKKLDEFRNNNVDLLKQLDGFKGFTDELTALREQAEKFKGLDPDTAREALEKAREISDQKLISEGKVEELLAQRVDRMRADFEGQVAALTEKAAKSETQGNQYKTKLTEVVIDNTLQAAAAGVASVKQGAMKYVLSNGRSVWKLDETGNPVPYDSEGKVMYGKDADKQLTPQEWAQGLLLEAPYLFEGSAGGGGQGNGADGSGGRVIQADDQAALNSNIEGLASGEVTVN